MTYYKHLNREALEHLDSTLRDAIELINRLPNPSSNLMLARRLMSVEQEWTCAELVRRTEDDRCPEITEAGRQALREVVR